MKQLFYIYFTSLLAVASFQLSYAQEVYFTNGFRISELTSTDAIVWTRLCGQKKPNPVVHQRKPKVFRHPINFDENMPVDEMDGAVRGADGYVRVIVESDQSSETSEWLVAEAKEDHTVHIPLEGLTPDTQYTIKLEGKAQQSDENIATISGIFRTPPADTVAAPVSFTSSTCQYFWSYDDSVAGFKTYLSMAELAPDFFVQTGDYVYYDKPGPSATNPEKARHKWHAINGWPSLVNFFRETPTYFIKDDHDLLSDDSHAQTSDYGELSYAEGLVIWEENVPMKELPYRTVRWGKDLQVWLLEGREYRSANQAPDGEGKTILGQQQKHWLTQTLSESDATFKVVISATPVVGPDRKNKTDNHSNASFQTEGEWLRNLLSQHENTYVINGDRHWQYVSQDSVTQLMEFGSGPVSDSHVQGWKSGKQPQHRYLNLIGGFLGVEVKREEGQPQLTFTHYDVNGEARNTELFKIDN
ncbi:alkaline phosphatase D family protein [Tunicatimonas pelagia]|uniref:alkaline phosphatase D family protein n=1 Tax=Tunicatimonas pelagia TaxID=931531 RepID=UPI002665646A|nr:alkaline phosphatase D family protein [Tunicatimonas pelagia]WKN42237.1 alkaline phosphatase D family protein [Tunicatimonas pelagia]